MPLGSQQQQSQNTKPLAVIGLENSFAVVLRWGNWLDGPDLDHLLGVQEIFPSPPDLVPAEFSVHRTRLFRYSNDLQFSYSNERRTMTDTPKKPGRPAKYGHPLTPAQRVKQSRERAFEAGLVAGENPVVASTTALLAGLARQIKLIDTDPGHAPVARDIAAQLIVELCGRYEIGLKQQ